MVRYTKADIKSIKYESINLIHLVADKVQLKAFINNVIKLRAQE
jgi:hypothetical protein